MKQFILDHLLIQNKAVKLVLLITAFFLGTYLFFAGFQEHLLLNFLFDALLLEVFASDYYLDERQGMPIWFYKFGIVVCSFALVMTLIFLFGLV